MDRTCFALPLLAGKTEAARAFLHELEGERKLAYAASEERLGLTKEVWAVQTLPTGDCFVVYFEGADIGRAFRQFAASQDAFDRCCLLYTSPSPRDRTRSRMPSSA